MPRQPFLPRYAAAPYEIGPGSLDARPELAALIGRCIGLWSEVELRMALIMAALLKANTEPAVALYLSIKNARVQKDALRAVAATTLNDDERLTFSAVLNVFGSIESERDALAHGIFGVSAEIPDGVLWSTTSDQASFLVKEVRSRMAKDGWTATPDANLRKSLFVYRKSDLELLYENIDRLDNMLFKLLIYLLGPDLNAGEYRQLCEEPHIARELSRLRDK
jgi:hypothetical protein